MSDAHVAAAGPAGLKHRDVDPEFGLLTGIVGDTRRQLGPRDELYGLALAAWTSQDAWPMDVAISFFADLERLWPRPQNWSPLDEPRARVAAKLLMGDTRITRTEIAAEFGVKSDTLRRRGVWDRVDEIISDRGPHPMHPTPDSRGITSWVGEVVGPGPNVVAFVLATADGGSSHTRYYQRATCYREYGGSTPPTRLHRQAIAFCPSPGVVGAALAMCATFMRPETGCSRASASSPSRTRKRVLSGVVELCGGDIAFTAPWERTLV